MIFHEIVIVEEIDFSVDIHPKQTGEWLCHRLISMRVVKSLQD